MTFRRRIGLLVAVAVVVVAAAVVTSVYVVVRAQLRADAEQELRALAEVVRSAASGGRLPAPVRGQAPSPPNVPRIIDADGSVVDSGSPEFALPVTPEARSVAAGRLESSTQAVRRGSERFGVVTLPLNEGLAVQVAQSFAPLDDVLSRLLRTSLVAGGTVILVAPLVGFLVAGGALVPVRRLRRTAENVARTADLTQRTEVGGNDDLAALGASFNAMLDRLEETIDTLERARHAQRQLVADASHELRTPLTALRANVELIALSSEMSAADRANLAADTVAQIEDLNSLMTQLIDLAREDEREPEHTPVQLDHVLEDALGRARQHHPEVSFVADLDPTVVPGAKDALSRAVANLLDNAGKWSPPGGTVEVGLSDGTLTVCDHGRGIDEGDLPHIFQRFYRGTRARGQPGSGLGLAIVAQVVASHGGKAWAERAPGGGARFTVKLPTADP